MLHYFYPNFKKVKLSASQSKKQQITSWIKLFGKTSSNVIVNDCSYKCYFTGKHVSKTMIIFPDEIESDGVYTVGKPLKDIEIPDIVKLGKRIILNTPKGRLPD